MKLTTRRVAQTSLRLPTLGFGAAPLGGLFDAVDEAQAAEALTNALADGMSYVDTAPFYGFGRSERRVGDQLRGQTYQLSTKVGRLLAPGALPDSAAMGWPDALPFHPVYDYSYDGIMRSFEDSLQRLGLDRIDILYVHDIGEMTHGAENHGHFKDLATSGYRALDELRSSGRVKAIGLGVNETEACLAALEIGDWDVFLLAGRYTLLEQGPLDDLFPKCAAKSISVVVGGPFNSGILVGGDTWNYGAAPEHILQRVRDLSDVCLGFDVPLPAAALQFPLGHDVVCSVIPGLRNPKELADTTDWVTRTIPEEFWQDLRNRDLLHPDAPVPTSAPFFEATS
ncbi:aldo/keto reductase [Octadecabacter ascidiaceicola]|uniref:Pyridoxal 4-dehydrogenase n=1 Tax=Octadecabacter ascidiaceicola TaxID=1655543 RepID=A0A238K6Z7_9RHOB|nr:aldo/keto reductase [Octadecabacter ascidiaceicola]SMX38214.1 Pyridoxal 4-dehydrogenase [Octadecabacter ascidiaceicola]